MRLKSMSNSCNKLKMIVMFGDRREYHSEYTGLEGREWAVQKELNNRADIITKLQGKTADLEKQNKQLEEYIGELVMGEDHIKYRIDDVEIDFKEQNKELAEQLSIMKSFTSNLVNRLDEQDKRMSSLLAYQKLSDWNTSNSFIITIQKVWRGYFVRKSIKMKLLELKKYLSTLCK